MLVQSLQRESTIQREAELIRIELQMHRSSIQALRCKHYYMANVFPDSFQLLRIPSPIPAAQFRLDMLLQTDFPVLSYSLHNLAEFAIMILKESQYCNNQEKQLMTKILVHLIASNYNIISYHNFSHAFSLMQLNYQCLFLQPQLSRLYTSEEQFYIMVAGLMHDINHPGTNNSFQVKLKTELSQRVHNESVLEHMHLRYFWDLLERNPSANFLLTCKQPQKAKEIITRLILNTDVAKHFRNTEKLKELRNQGFLDLESNAITNNRWFLMEQIFHGCDIGNPCLGYDNYISWVALLSHEFNEQAKQEQINSIEVTASFVYTNHTGLYKDQVWFLGEMVWPLWQELTLVCPAWKQLLANIKDNLARIKENYSRGLSE